MGKTIQAVSLIVTHSEDESPPQPVTPAAVPPQPAARRSKLRLASSAGTRPAGSPAPASQTDASSMVGDSADMPAAPSEKQTLRSSMPDVPAIPRCFDA